MSEEDVIKKVKALQMKEKEELKRQIQDYMRSKPCCTQQELREKFQKPAKMIKEALTEMNLQQRGETYCVKGRE